MARWIYDEGMEQGSRQRQEDAYGITQLPADLQAGDVLLVLADGMGGERAGGRASTLAVRIFTDRYCAGESGSIPERLQDALLRMNESMAEDVATDADNLSGMGCTLLAVVLSPEGMYWVSVGDSPLWLFREGQLHRINQDHAYRSVLLYQVAQGEISEAEAARHPDRNALISAVTGDALELIDLPSEALPLGETDQVLLASDGILTLAEAEMTAVLAEASSPPVAALLTAVMDRQAPYQDNVTIVWAQAAADVINLPEEKKRGATWETLRRRLNTKWFG